MRYWGETVIIDRYFNPEDNVYCLAAEIISMLSGSSCISAVDLFSRIEKKYPGNYDSGVFEAVGLLFLTDKIVYSSERDCFFLKK